MWCVWSYNVRAQNEAPEIQQPADIMDPLKQIPEELRKRYEDCKRDFYETPIKSNPHFGQFRTSAELAALAATPAAAANSDHSMQPITKNSK
jgi:hypothetical protein